MLLSGVPLPQEPLQPTCVKEAVTECLAEQLANGGLPAAHHANQEQASAL
jgi:hypothetical protein